jgi:cell division septation protein DedD
MTDQGFREIQLSGKQLVFLFMASVVLAVVVFLLGVSVGRGVRENAGPPSAPAEADADVRPPTELPPPTTLTADDMKFGQVLQGNAPGGATAPPATAEAAKPVPAEDPPVVDEPVATTTAARPPQTSAPAPAPAGAKPVATPGAVTQKPAGATARVATPAGSGWLVQVGAFGTRANADNLVQRLLAKGYSAVVVPGGSLFRVRVGPYAERAEADRAAARLRQEEKGTQPSVIR